MVDGTAQHRPEDGAGSETPTPPTGIPRGGAAYFTGRLGDDLGDSGASKHEQPRPGANTPDVDPGELTPPYGTPGIVGVDGVVDESDFGHAAPAVLGEPASGSTASQDVGPGGEADEYRGADGRSEADDWPKLEYRSRSKPKRAGAMDWIRRRRDG